MKKTIPHWHNEMFPRISGLTDKVFRKVGIWDTEGSRRLHSGRVVRNQRRFDAYQYKVQERLLNILAPLEQETCRLARRCQETVVPPEPGPARTTGAARSAAAVRVRKTELLTKQNADKARLAQLCDEIRRWGALADSYVDQGLSKANRGLAIYSKACYFKVVEQEIPELTRRFFANQVINQSLMAQAAQVLNGAGLGQAITGETAGEERSL